MKILAPFFTSLVVSIWVVAIAIISVQNATPVSLKFLIFESVKIPAGLVLAFCAGIGFISVGVLQPLWSLGDSGQRNSRFEDDAEFFVDDEDF
ncbi:LapA family protein [Nostoc sp. UHCC 0702]|nr:LapA family protein [Nostoc sp. UHCC 0702]